jgi:hypothetical protein
MPTNDVAVQKWWWRHVPRQFNHLHSVNQRSRDRVGRVGGAEEQHLGQVDRNVKVVVCERVVLLWVEELEQCRRWVSVVRPSDLVNFVDEDKRVFTLALLQALDRFARHGTHVPVTDKRVWMIVSCQ